MPVDCHGDPWFPEDWDHEKLTKVTVEEVEKNFPELLKLKTETDAEERLAIFKKMFGKVLNQFSEKLSIVFVDALTKAGDETEKIPFEKYIHGLGFAGDFEELTYIIGMGEHDLCHFLNKNATPFKDRVYYDIRGGKRDVIIDKDRSLATYFWVENDKKVTQHLHNGYTLEIDGIKIAWMSDAKQVGNNYVDVIICNKGEGSKAIAALEKLYQETSLFKNRVVSVEVIGESHSAVVNISIQDIEERPSILPRKAQKKVDRVTEIITNWDKIPQGQRKEGLILYGPPGTGKSSAISGIVNKVKGRCTVFNIKSATLKFFRSIYNFAHKLGPNIVICEDVDSLQINRDNYGTQTNVTSTLLNLLDGSDNKDVITICTTNHPEHLDAALVRPGRLGVSIEIGSPSLELKTEIVKLYGNIYKIDIGEPRSVAEKYFSESNVHGCHIAETFKRMSTAKILGKDPLVELQDYIEEMADRKNIFNEKVPASKKFGLGAGSFEDDDD